jgi:hypothetical protein
MWSSVRVAIRPGAYYAPRGELIAGFVEAVSSF